MYVLCTELFKVKIMLSKAFRHIYMITANELWTIWRASVFLLLFLLSQEYKRELTKINSLILAIIIKIASHWEKIGHFSTLQDRSLPQVQKGQMVRCLGSFQVTHNIFHCVAIRIVSPTEQRWMKAQISACDKALRSELAVIKIEP